jgi:hypothetical protein
LVTPVAHIGYKNTIQELREFRKSPACRRYPGW